MPPAAQSWSSAKSRRLRANARPPSPRRSGAQRRLARAKCARVAGARAPVSCARTPAVRRQAPIRAARARPHRPRRTSRARSRPADRSRPRARRSCDEPRTCSTECRVEPLVQPRHADQRVAAVERGTEHDAPPRRVASTAARRMLAGKVGLSALTRIAPSWRQSSSRVAVDEPRAEIALALRQQAESRRQQRAQRGLGSGRRKHRVAGDVAVAGSVHGWCRRGRG